MIPTLWPHLFEYLSNTSLLSAVQIGVLYLIVALLIARTCRVLRLPGTTPLPAEEPVANDLVQGLTQLCVGMGLVLTFAGVFQFIGGDQSQGSWALLLALGSSAIGYSSYALTALGSIADGLATQVELPTARFDHVSADGNSTPSTTSNKTASTRKRSSKRNRHETANVDDSGRRSRHLGDPVCAPLPAPQGLGSLDGYQLRDIDSVGD